MSFFRFLKIVFVIFRYGLDELIFQHVKSHGSLLILKILRLGRSFKQPAPVRLRLALEELGPIFIKFGQLLSTRPDLVTPAFARELSALQDRVPPFPSEQSIAIITQSFGKPLDALFGDFTLEPVASASVAQVHRATLLDGRVVAVKVLRPGTLKAIEKDLALLRILARWMQRLLIDGKRLRPVEVVNEFDKYLHDELDLQIEAANCSQLRRNFEPANRQGLIHIPEVIWTHTNHQVFTMEWMEGVGATQLERLDQAGIDRRELARKGVEIFFMQVFEDGFFHADMHPGNILVSIEGADKGQYIALDFGIVGSLSDFDKNYLAQNFLAFFRRDYQRVAQLHIESGWVPADTREEELTAAVRAVCEPYFDLPIAQISLGQVLMRLFQTSRRFNVEIQPQLVLLQKTLLNVEGMGRELDPNLDLWDTAKPFLEKWMHKRLGFASLIDHIQREMPYWGQIFPQLPRLTYQKLQQEQRLDEIQKALNQLSQRRRIGNYWLALIGISFFSFSLLVWLFLFVVFAHDPF